MLATSCDELTHWKRLWYWEGLRAGGEGDDKGWDGWMVSPIRWTWIWVNSRSWWWTGRPGMLWFMGSQRVGHNWATELNWTELRSSPSTKYHMCLTNSICMSNSTTVVAVQRLSHVQLFVTPRTAAHQPSLSFTIFQHLLKLMSIELMMLSNHLIHCCALLLLPSI